MESKPFNLIDEPWILVRYCDGKIREVSLTTLFADMREIHEIVGELPTQAFAIFRTILAIVYRALEVETADEWFEWYRDPAAAQETISDYLNHFHDRFDLRHPQYPFYQVADLHTEKDETKPLSAIIGDVPPSEQFFTTRLVDHSTAISWAEAARWLIYIHQFDPAGIRSGVVDDPRQKGGKSYPIGTGWSGQIGGLYIKANHLFNTLMRNVVPISELASNDNAFPYDTPAWERTGRPKARDSLDFQEPQGPIDVLTWQARRVRLIGNDDTVTSVVLTNGDKINPRNLYGCEPLTSWRFSEPQTKNLKAITYMPKTHSEKEQIWRSLSSIVAQLSSKKQVKVKSQILEVDAYRSADVLVWNQKILDSDLLGVARMPIVMVRVVGAVYGTQSSTITEIVNDEIEFPADLFNEENCELTLTVRDGLELMEKIAGQIYSLVQSLAKKFSPNSAKERASNAKQQFYASIDRDFRQWLRNVSSREDLESWKVQLLTHAWEAETTIANSISSTKIFDTERYIKNYRYEVRKILGVTAPIGNETR